MIDILCLKLNQSSQALSVILGLSIIIIFTYVLITGNDPYTLFNWSLSVLGLTFIIILFFLIACSIICIINMFQDNLLKRQFWFESGLQFSNGISTIALTYTLLGISLGIGELSSSKLDILSIDQTISKLTNQFSMAFMTSVIGLPVAAILKSLLIICLEHLKTKEKPININLIR